MQGGVRVSEKRARDENDCRWEVKKEAKKGKKGRERERERGNILSKSRNLFVVARIISGSFGTSCRETL